MSNSPLVDYTKLSPFKNTEGQTCRNHIIDTLTIHCYVGQASVESMGSWFSNPRTNASCNYGIGSDGRIALIVEEKDRSWCSSSPLNDNRAITIECASDSTHPYAINDRVYKSLIALCTDICKRNKIKELKWKADKTLIGQQDKQNMTVHRWFDNKACPGDYIYNRLGQIAKEVNARLGVENQNGSGNKRPNKPAKRPWYRVRKTWADEASQLGAFHDVKLAKKSVDEHPGYSVFDENGKCVYAGNDTAFKPFLVRVDIPNLNIRKGPGTNYEKTGDYTRAGEFTIVDIADGPGSKNGWGKLKSGAGWISLDYTRKIE